MRSEDDKIINSIATNLKLLKDGIWTSNNLNSKISFPEKVHSNRFKFEENSFWFNHRNNCLLEVLKGFPPAGRFFDIGGGNGYTCYILNKNGYSSTLVEPLMNGVINAKERGVKSIIYSSFENVGFKNNSLPAVGLFDVMEHIKDDCYFFKNIYSLLIPGGKLYITVPSYNFLWSSKDDFVGHFRRYTIKELEKKLEIANFKIEYATYIFNLFPIFIYLFRALPDKLKMIKASSLKTQGKEHKQPNRIVNKIINFLLTNELKVLRRKGKFIFGASCLIVARKKE